jgi:transmembrane sensor
VSSRSNEDWAAQVLRDVDPAWGAETVEHQLGAMHRRRRRRTARRAALGGVVLAAGLASAVVWAWPASSPSTAVAPTPPSGEPGAQPLGEQASEAQASEPQASEPQAPEAPVLLADGSTLTPVGDGRIVVDRDTADRVHVTLEAGAVDVEATPRADRELVVLAGAVRVTVLGTVFRVDRLDAERTRVSVERGHVRVDWDEGSSDLRAGERGTFPPAETAEVTARGNGSGRARDWRAVATRGGYDEAYALMQRQGAGAVRDEVDDLLLAADTARLSGHPDRALPYLRRVVEGHPRDERAPMAAFTRGRLMLASGQHDAAARSFEASLDLGARGSLSENALARAIEAHGRGGDAVRARALAVRYVDLYPRGRWLASVRAFGGLDE